MPSKYIRKVCVERTIGGSVTLEEKKDKQHDIYRVNRFLVIDQRFPFMSSAAIRETNLTRGRVTVAEEENIDCGKCSVVQPACV